MATSKRARGSGGKRARVAVVAGATRGAGRGVARGLGEAGYVVYCTGRSFGGVASPYGRRETLEETVALAGERAIGVRVDHTAEREVVALFERVIEEQGGVDVVVDSVAGEDPSMAGWTGMLKTDLSKAETALKQSLLSHLYTAKHGALALMKRRPRGGLLVELTEFDLLLGGGGNLVSATVKTALKSLAFMLAEELGKHRVSAVSMTPGFSRSEVVLDHFGVTEDNWRDAGQKDPHFLHSETPVFIGRAIAALAGDAAGCLARNGQVLSSWEIARAYGVVDVDRRAPHWGDHWRDEVVPSMKWLRDGLTQQVVWLEQLAARGRAQLGDRRSAKPAPKTERAARRGGRRSRKAAPAKRAAR